MNKLSTHIADFSRHRRALPVARITTWAKVPVRPHRSQLLCHWHNDPDTGQLSCAWVLQDAAQDAEILPRLRLAS